MIPINATARFAVGLTSNGYIAGSGDAVAKTKNFTFKRAKGFLTAADADDNADLQAILAERGLEESVLALEELMTGGIFNVPVGTDNVEALVGAINQIFGNQDMEIECNRYQYDYTDFTDEY